MLITLALHVALAFPPALPPPVARIAVAEAAGIWAPYGVSITLAGPCGWGADDTTVLGVIVEEDRQPTRVAAWRAALGAIRFDPDGTPAPTVTVYLSDVLRFIAGVRFLGAGEPRWPQMLREQIVGRVLGRVLSHEIGHFLLRTRQHTAVGLMRAVQYPDDLVAVSRKGFTISPPEAMRLRPN